MLSFASRPSVPSLLTFRLLTRPAMLLRPTLIAFVLALVSATSFAAEKPEPAKEVIYRKTPQAELKLFLHYPPDWKASDTRPAIVFFFGGGWTGGTPTQFERQAEYLASRGMVAA